MDFLEKDLEEIIYLSDKNILSDRGLNLHGKLKRQLRIGNYGVLDLLEITRPYCCNNKCYKGIINLIELKKDKIGVSTFFQALNYIKGIKRFLDIRNQEYLFNYQITLIGRQIDLNSSFCYLGDIFNQNIEMTDIDDYSKINVELYKYNFDVEGIKFNEIINYKLINEGF